MNSRGQVKLSDFGIAAVLEETKDMSFTCIGTFRYMSEDRLLGEAYNASSDIWSTAVMLIELWSKRYPFEDCCTSPVDLVQALEDISLSHRGMASIIPTNCSHSMAQFLYYLLTTESKKVDRAKTETG